MATAKYNTDNGEDIVRDDLPEFFSDGRQTYWRSGKDRSAHGFAFIEGAESVGLFEPFSGKPTTNCSEDPAHHNNMPASALIFGTASAASERSAIARHVDFVIACCECKMHKTANAFVNTAFAIIRRPSTWTNRDRCQD